MLSPWLVVLFRLIHIVVGVFWVGSVLFLSAFLFPAVRTLGPAGGPVMSYLTQVRGMPTRLLIAALVTIASGLVLYWHDSLGFHSEWIRSPSAMVFGAGAVCALLAVVVGLLVNNPTAKRVGALAGAIQRQGGPPNPEQAAEMQRLQLRLSGALRVVTVLLLLAVAAMAVARYVG